MEHKVNILGIDIAYVVYGPVDAGPIVCLHGWLDNAASFEQLAPLLCAKHRLFVLDLPGHGLSGQRPPSGSYNVYDDLPTLLLFINTVVKRERVTMLGHSRGAMTSVIFAAALGPSRVERLILLDGLYPSMIREEDVATQLAGFTVDFAKPRAVYPPFETLSDAIELRQAKTKEPDEVAGPLMRRNYDPATGLLRTDERLNYRSAIKVCRREFFCMCLC